MERNIKVARAHRALGVLYICLIALLAVILALDPNAIQSAVIIAVIIFGILIAAHLVTAKGARQVEPWARISSIIISLILLVGFPIGTLIGIYLLANTWKPWPQKPAEPVAS